MELTRRKLAVLFVVGFVIGSVAGPAIAAVMNGVFVEEGVTVRAADGPAVTLSGGDIEVNGTAMFDGTKAVDGDARTAIKTLEFAARLAAELGADEIATAHVEDAVEGARVWVRTKATSRLRPHVRVLYDVLDNADGDWLSMGELHNEYAARVAGLDVGEPRSQRSALRWLEKLQDYNLIEVQGSTGSRKYRRIGFKVPSKILNW